MSTQDAFLRAIVESPDDDAPRLVYADWLEDHGGSARADLIRVQCELARGVRGVRRRLQLEARQRGLLAEHGRAWARPLAKLVKGWEFRRGFVERVVVEARPFLAQADTIFRLAPVCDVRIEGGN